MSLSKVMYDLRWQTFGAYLETEDGWFVPDPSAPFEPRQYEPATEPGLVSAVAQLHAVKRDNEHKQTLLDFLRDFGCLGQTSLSKNYRRIEERFADGDSRQWLESHGRSIHLIMLLHEAHENGDPESLRNILAALHGRQERAGSTFLAAGDNNAFIELPLEPYLANPFDTAQAVIEAILNLNLGGVDRAVEKGKDVFRFKALFQLVYWRLRDELAAARPVRRCMGCRRNFFVYDSRQKFCSPPPFAKESRCAVKRRVLKYRAKADPAGS